jgi:hypothetical protein
LPPGKSHSIRLEQSGSEREDFLSAIHDLIAQISDPRLRDRLAAEWVSASKEKKFGLVFEEHLPELLPLHKAKPRKSDLRTTTISFRRTVETPNDSKRRDGSGCCAVAPILGEKIAMACFSRSRLTRRNGRSLKSVIP